MKIVFVPSLLVFGMTGYSSQAIAQPVAWTASDSRLPVTISLGVTSLAIDPVKPTELYALTNIGVMFKSKDAGGNWERSNSSINAISLLAIAPGNSALYAATPDGLVKSLNGGETWVDAGAGLTGNILSFAISPSNPSILYACTQRGLFRSANGGEAWKAVFPVTSGDAVIFGLVIAPASPSTIYVARAGSMFKSTDGGETYTRIRPDAADDYYITSLAVHPAHSLTIYASYRRLPPGLASAAPQTVGVFKSTDGGRTWNDYPLPATYNYLGGMTIDPITAAVYVVVSSNRGGAVVKSTDGGQSWNSVNDALPGSFKFAFDPLAPSTIYAYCSQEGCGALFKSTPEGGSWKPSGTGLGRIDATVLTIDPANGTLYAGVGDGLFKSSDDGASWTHSYEFAARPVPPGFNQRGAGYGLLRTILIDFSNPRVLYVQTRRQIECRHNDKVVFKSTDSGASWDDGFGPADSGCRLGGAMAMDPLDSNTLYLVESYYDQNVTELLKSGDGGGNWTSIWKIVLSEVSALAVDPRNSTTLYAGVFADYDDNGLTNGVYKSTDGGATWNVTGLMNTWATLLVIDPSDPRTLYAGTTRGLFKTTDGGENWLAVNNGLPALTFIGDGAAVAFLAMAPDRSNVIYAGTSGRGVYKSVDGAASWVKFNDGLTNLNVRALAISPGSPNKLFAATAAGVFSITDEDR